MVKMNKPKSTETPSVPHLAPERPKGMTTLARQEWNRVVPLLAAMKVIGLADTVAIQIYCEAYSTYRQACKILAKDGLYYKTEKGMMRPHPAIATRNQSVREMKAMIGELGLSPASRTRVQVQQTPEPTDPATKFFGGK